MDRGEGPIRLLIAAAALTVAAAASSAPRQPLQALVWTAPGAERAVLLRQPAACLDPAADPLEVAYGRALFHAPQLLGGQAARAGISCASCHAGGRRSAAFFLDGVSGAPGSADVSASFFSLARANHTFDPKPIPDLALPGKVPRTGDALKAFTHGLIVEEFAGREPAPHELAAVAGYVQALRPCAVDSDRPRGLGDDLGLLRETIGASIQRAELGDGSGASLLVSAARFRLGLIDERYPPGGFSALHKQLLAASRALQPVGVAQSPTAAGLRSWLARFERDLVPPLQRGERRSLYEPRQVERWLEGRR
ncbi:MAG: hypothetical protein ACREBO_05675 [Novosphingobium sp.]